MENQPMKTAFTRVEGWRAEAENWKSDIIFYEHELGFLRDLVGGHFMHIVKQESLPAIQKMMLDIKKLEQKRELLIASVTEHCVHLEDQIAIPEKLNPKLSENEHASLKGKMHEFFSFSKVVKTEVFGIMAHVKGTEKLRRVLES